MNKMINIQLGLLLICSISMHAMESKTNSWVEKNDNEESCAIVLFDQEKSGEPITFVKRKPQSKQTLEAVFKEHLDAMFQKEIYKQNKLEKKVKRMQNDMSELMEQMKESQKTYAEFNQKLGELTDALRSSMGANTNNSTTNNFPLLPWKDEDNEGYLTTDTLVNAALIGGTGAILYLAYKGNSLSDIGQSLNCAAQEVQPKTSFIKTLVDLHKEMKNIPMEGNDLAGKIINPEKCIIL